MTYLLVNEDCLLLLCLPKVEGRSSVIETFRQLLVEEGVWGMTKGLSARIISSLPTSVLIVVGYETLKRLSLRADLIESRHWWKGQRQPERLFLSADRQDLLTQAAVSVDSPEAFVQAVVMFVFRWTWELPILIVTPHFSFFFLLLFAYCELLIFLKKI